MKNMILTKGKVIMPDKVLENAAVGIADGKISFIKENFIHEVKSLQESDCKIIDLDGYYLAPGYVDLHIHGGDGWDFYDSGQKGITSIVNHFAKHGTTTLIATLTTANIGKMEKAMEEIIHYINNRSNDTGADIAGIYIEGPFCNVKRKGTFKEEFLLMPDVKLIDRWIEKFGKYLSFIGLAPELEGSEDIIKMLLDNGIKPCIAHSDATYDEAVHAFDLGIRHVTHCYNALSGLHHRDPGVVGALLTDDKVTTEIICDFHHVHPAAIEVLIKCKTPDRVCLITDAMRATGLPDGEYVISEQKAILKDGEVKINGTTLAGSVLTMDVAVKNMYKLGFDLVDVVRMATLTPAIIAGIDDKVGSIEVGKDADLVILNEQLDICATLLKGKNIILN